MAAIQVSFAPSPLPLSLFLAVMADQQAAAGGVDPASRDDVSYKEVGVDVDGLSEAGKRSPAPSDTTSQLGTDETDGKSSKKKKKAASRIIQDGKPC